MPKFYQDKAILNDMKSRGNSSEFNSNFHQRDGSDSAYPLSGIYHPSDRENSNKRTAIDSTYDQWNKFENFLKFAQKKEVRDRLKEFDAPNIANYIDPDTIDKINKTHKTPA